MTHTRSTTTVALLAMPEATGSTLFGMLDLLSSAGRDWSLITTGKPGISRFQPHIVAASAAGFRAANGVFIQPDRAIADTGIPDIVCIPELFVAPDAKISGRFPQEIRWLRECHQSGAMIAAACSGALMLAEAGLLDGLDATTHWGYCATLKEHYPLVRVHPDRALVITGEGDRIIMAGGGTSWQDLGLFLIARITGIEDALRVARIHLIDWHHGGQQPFAVLSRSRQVDDPLIARCQAWVAEHYDQHTPVTAMVRLTGLPERSFKRRFTRATGLTPMQYVHTLRLEEAKQMLESTTLPVEAIAGEVGYEDCSFFGRLFHRKVGLTPGQYRRRFSALHRALHGSAEAQQVEAEAEPPTA